jgi:transcriptional regulator with XRE-family HTH domain
MERGRPDLLDLALSEARARSSLPEPRLRRLLRDRVGVTQEAVASAVGVSRPAISRYETGAATPRGDRLHRYLAVLQRLDAEAGVRRGREPDPLEESLDEAAQSERGRS